MPRFFRVAIISDDSSLSLFDFFHFDKSGKNMFSTLKTPWFQTRVLIVCIQMRQPVKSVSGGRYDKILRENLERPGQLVLGYFFNDAIFKTQSMPNRIRQHIIEKETDTLVLLKEEGEKP